MRFRILRRILVLVLAGCLAVIAAIHVKTCFGVWRQSRTDEARPADAIVVLGAAQYVGRPSPVLRARLDHGLRLYRNGLAPFVITTGGAGGDPSFSEGGVGHDYLLAHGIPDSNLIAETQGGDTLESVKRVAVIMHTNRLRSCVAVSDAYHLYRVKRLMEKQGITVYGSPREGSIPKTGWMRFWAIQRESFSYMFWTTVHAVLPRL